MNPNSQQCSSNFDAYGSLLIILFLMSSVREQSGWSTMTGRVSFERFEVSSEGFVLCNALTKLMDIRLCTLRCEA